MSDQATYGIAITADDKTAKGVKSAEKRIGQIPKHASAASRSVLDRDQRRVGQASRSILRTFGAIEQASARALGNRSITAGVAGRIGEVRAAASALGTGLGEAAASGGILSTTLGVVGVAAGATVGVLAAAAYGAFKLANGWAQGASSIGHMAENMGVATKALQEFTAAGERVGVDKAAGAAALGGLNQTLNDARYGRNNDAIALLARMGVKLQLNKDGTVDTAAMLPAIATAMQRQNSSGRRTAARILGISEAALPAFTQGGAALSADMKDAGVHAGIVSDQDVVTGKRIVRKGAMISQLKDRAMLAGGKVVAENTEKGWDVALAGGQALMDGSETFGGVVRNSFKPAAEKLDRAADALRRSIVGTGMGAGRLTPGQVSKLARKALPLQREAMQYGFSPAEATGIAANVVMESGGDHRSRERGGNGRGLIQWTDKKRKAEFRRVVGVDVEHASRDQQWRFLRYELSHKEKSGWNRTMAAGQDPAAIAAGYARHVERPQFKDRDSAERAAVAREMAIKLEIVGLPKGAQVRATGGNGARPAISHAMAR